MVPMSKAVLLVAGLAGGALLALGVQYALKEPGSMGRTAATQKALEDAQGKIQRLERDLNAATQRADDLELRKTEALVNSGFFLLGDEGLPPVRERLLTYTEPQAVITLIELLKQKGDKGAIENLKKLAADEGRPESIRKSAEGALKVLEASK